MTERQIRLFGDPVLRSACDLIKPGDTRVKGLIEDLLETVKVPGRAGLAANQIGVGLRAFSYNIDGEVGYVINPVLAEVSGEPEALQHETDHLDGHLYIEGLEPETKREAMRAIRQADWY
jgi:peptide deformylase